MATAPIVPGTDYYESPQYKALMQSMGFRWDEASRTFVRANSVSPATGTAPTSTADFSSMYKDLSNLQFDQTKQMMSLSNQFREKEGATQKQVDDQAFKRQSAEIETRKYLQNNAANITEKQRTNDAARAQAALRGSKGLF